MASKLRNGPDERRWRWLMDKAQEGNQSAYREMLESFQKWLIAYFEISIKLAEDIIRSAHLKLSSCGAKQSVSDWLEAIAQYKISRCM